MMPQDPTLRKRGSTGIRSDALLLPASLRYDWQHSSSQLPITNRRPLDLLPQRALLFCAECSSRPVHRETPEPTRLSRNPCAGLFTQRGMHARDAWVPFRSSATARRVGALYEAHQSGGDLLLPTLPTGLAAPLLPSCQSISATPAGPPPPAGVAFCAAPRQWEPRDLNHCGKSPEFSQNFAKIFA